MKTILRTTAAGLAIASLGIASAASAATDTASVTAEILSTLTVTAVSGDDVLDFGDIAPQASLSTTSTVVVAPDGTGTCGADLVCSGTTNAPTFDVTGLAGSQVAVSFPSGTATLTRAGAVPSGMTGTMSVGSFTSSANTLNLTSGTGQFTMGGTLTVAANQAPGVYTGSVTVEVLYN